MPQNLDFSDHFFGVVDISKYIVDKLNSDHFVRLQVLSFDDLSKAALPEILDELVVACDVVPLSRQDKVALLLLACLLFHLLNCV